MGPTHPTLPDFIRWLAKFDSDTFEEVVATILAAHPDWEIDTTDDGDCGNGGGDGGFDIKLTHRKEGWTVLIDAKRVKAPADKNIGPRTVRMVAGMGAEHGVSRVAVATNTGFTDGRRPTDVDGAKQSARAIRQNQGIEVALISGEDLYEMVAATNRFDIWNEYAVSVPQTNSALEW